MRTHHLIKFGAAALLSFTLAACQSTDDMADESSSMEEDMSSSTGGAQTMPAGMRDGITEEEFQTESAARRTNVFYFEFDKSDLNAEAREALVYHANYLKRHPEVSVRLEGHADERGTREYNLALGERRAQAVERYLQVQGVSSRQLETISYGEERPADPGTTEAAYSRNRRVEMK